MQYLLLDHLFTIGSFEMEDSCISELPSLEASGEEISALVACGMIGAIVGFVVIVDPAQCCNLQFSFFEIRPLVTLMNKYDCWKLMNKNGCLKPRYCAVLFVLQLELECIVGFCKWIISILQGQLGY